MSRFSRREWLTMTGFGAAALGLPLRSALADDAATDGSFPGEWTFGEVKVTKVLDVVEPFDAARAYPGAPLEAFAEQAAWLPPYFYDPSRKAIIFSFHSYLLRSRGLTMIVDTCWGEDTPLRRGQHRGKWLRNLAAAGVRPEDVDVVTCTHFHSDHVGWNTRLQDGRFVPTFPNARHLFSSAEIEGLEADIKSGKTQPTTYEQSIRPVLESGRVIRLDGAHDVADGIRIVPSPGHSPGHQCVEIDSKGRRAVLTGDLLHNPIEVRHPEWTKLFDQDKQAAMAQRKRFLDAHTDVDVTILAAHFSGPTAGHVVSTPGGRIFRTLGARGPARG
jgi:glyoxylase-like metal-dependent hydrolase (beta-lactamase superfamily II)